MAFAINTAPAAQNNNQNDSWKAQAFINLYVPKPDGGRSKIGAIPLKASKKFERALIERLQQEGAVEALLDKLEIDFQMVDDSVPAEVGF